MTNQKKINVYFEVFPLSTERTSGVGHLIAETIRALEGDTEFGRRYNLILIAPKSGIKNVKRWGFKNVEIRAIPVKGRIWSALVLYRLLPPADLYFGKGVYVFGNYTTWPLLRSKAITYIHDLNFIVNPSTVKPKTYKVLKKNIPLWIKRADRLVTISEFSKSEINRFYNRNDAEVVYCGVDKVIFYPRTDEEVSTVKKKYGIPGDYALFLSNVEPRKNVERVLDAYCLLSDELKSRVSLVIVGADGWLNEEVSIKIDAMRSQGLSVIWPKEYVPDEDRPLLLSGAQVLVHPALYEGFGIPPLEALACGTPVLVSNTTSLPEVAGDVGIYVDPVDVRDIANKLDQALMQDKAPLMQSMITQSNKFKWETAARKLTELIDDLVK